MGLILADLLARDGYAITALRCGKPYTEMSDAFFRIAGPGKQPAILYRKMSRDGGMTLSPSRRLLACYLAAPVVNQTCGVPLTPAFSIVVLRSGDDAKDLALSAVLKSCVTVTSFGLSRD